jgi:hypothetical protein
VSNGLNGWTTALAIRHACDSARKVLSFRKTSLFVPSVSAFNLRRGAPVATRGSQSLDRLLPDLPRRAAGRPDSIGGIISGVGGTADAVVWRGRPDFFGPHVQAYTHNSILLQFRVENCNSMRPALH